ncbi:MAG: ATP-binding cassette domain-containing protein [Calditrichaeota bacterium]|nr:ATP-binding cassette domain-containing protein [Calditrichota bacterium]RQV99042.1 MAG: ATP-binding cassette domain-containing protein [Calditrichota bacterium]
MIHLKNVSKSFPGIQALHNINLAIPAEQTTVLIGPSGCGKSTLIRLIIGLIPLDSGNILVNQQNINRSNLPEIRKNVGYVIQEGGLFPHMTSRENITLMARQAGFDKKKSEQRLLELAELTKFPGNALDRYPLMLSGGQQQRVSLMRALMLDPDILLMDEPLGSLDPMIRYDLQEDLKSIFRELKKTVLLVTHDLGEAGYFGDVIVLMKEGTLVQKGSLDDLLNLPADSFVTQFIRAQRAFDIGPEGSRG